MSAECQQKAANDVRIDHKVEKKSRILVDDILLIIFESLNCWDLLRLESTSDKFRQCARIALRSKRKFSVGWGDLTASGITKVIANTDDYEEDIYRYDLTASHKKLAKLMAIVRALSQFS